ncbi:MAG TPA: M35 family metallo-endopeptidase [Pirellulales bacterium]|nr:M35 family metallo-endopeptidase [Pirellulales bacterium]
MTQLFRHLRNTLLAAGLSTSSVALAQDARMSADPAMYGAPPAATSFADLVPLIGQDLANERNMLAARRNDLLRWDADAQAAFRAAFGTDDPAARRQVLACVDRELALNSQLSARNFQPAAASQPGRYAYVDHDDSSTIYLDRLYGSAPAVGPDSRAGTLVHEMSHFNNTCATEDYAYGEGNAAALANEYAQGRSNVQPWRNADNVEYYMEDALGRRAAANSRPARQTAPPLPVAQSPARTTGRVDDGVVGVGALEPTHAGGHHSLTASTETEGPTDALEPTLEQPSAPDSSSMPVADGTSSAGERLTFDESAARRPNAGADNSAVASAESSASNSPQMTNEQFRADMEATMRQFQQTAEGQQRALRNRPGAVTGPSAFGDSAVGRPSQAVSPSDTVGRPSQAVAATSPRQNRLYLGDGSSRPIGAANGRYDANGYYASQPGTLAPVRQNRAYSGDGSSRPIGAGNGRYDADGYYASRPGTAAPVRQNRAYSGDGSSRPIGASASAASAFRAFQQQANNQIAMQQRGRGNSLLGYSNGNSGGSSSSGETNSGGQSSSARSDAASSSSTNASTGGSGIPAPSARLTFDDDAPRQSASSQAVVTPRQPATSQPTANAMPVDPAVTPRQSGSASQTAGIVPLN